MCYIGIIENGEPMNPQEFIDLLFYPQTEEFHKNVSDVWLKGALTETFYGVLYTMVIYIGCYLIGG